jgi:hypothetical protein
VDLEETLSSLLRDARHHVDEINREYLATQWELVDCQNRIERLGLMTFCKTKSAKPLIYHHPHTNPIPQIPPPSDHANMGLLKCPYLPKIPTQLPGVPSATNRGIR